MTDPKKPLGRILLQQKAITQAELDVQLEQARKEGVPLATQLTNSGKVTEIAALKALSEQKGVPGIELSQICIRLRDLDVLPREVALRHKLLPILTREDRLFCAMASPTDKKVIDELEFVTGKRVFAYIALEGPLIKVLHSAYDLKERGEQFYIGPACPVDAQRKAGVVTVRPPAMPDEPLEPAPAVAPEPERSAPLMRPDAGPTVDWSRASHDAPVVRPPAVEPPSASPPAAPLPTAPAASEPVAKPRPRPRRPGRYDSRTEPESERPAAPAGGEAPKGVSELEIDARPGHRRPEPRSEDLHGRDKERRFRPSTEMRAVASPDSQVVVDDAMARFQSEVSDDGFGDDADERSVVMPIPVENERAAPPNATGLTVLIVDDEPDIRKLLRRVFEGKGYRVREAERGLLALQMVKQSPPDVLILDAMLPEVHGFEIARRIRGSERYGHIPIVMISAVYRGWRFAEDAKASYGVDAYLEKPFKVADVLAAVEAAVATPSERRDPEAISQEAERLLAAGIRLYKAGDLDGATASLEKGTNLDPLAYRLHFHLGLLYGKRGQLYDAIQELETALQINSAHFPALKNLAVLYQQAGFKNKAIETWERALRVAPDDATRQTIKEHLLGLL